MLLAEVGEFRQPPPRKPAHGLPSAPLLTALIGAAEQQGPHNPSAMAFTLRVDTGRMPISANGLTNAFRTS